MESSCWSGLVDQKEGQAAFFCMMEGLHEVAMDHNEMHEHGRRQRGSCDDVACLRI